MCAKVPSRTPLVSVVIPAYCHQRYVAEALLSALAQPVDLEVLLCDDASDDATFAAAHAIDDPRIRRWRHATNLGADITLNELILRARGHYIAILNSDDQFHPQRLCKCLPLLLRGEADLVGTDIRLIDAEGKVVTEHWWIDAYNQLKAVWRQERDWLAALWAGNLFVTSSNFIFPRRLWARLGGFRRYRYVLDYDFLLRALAEGARLAWLEEPLLDYRLHDYNTIFSEPLAANLEASMLLRETLPLLTSRVSVSAAAWRHFNAQWSRIEALEIAILRDEQHRALVRKDQEWQQTLQEAQHAWQQQNEALRQSASHLISQYQETIAAQANCPSVPATLAQRVVHWVRRFPHTVKNQLSLARRVAANPPLRLTGFAALRRWLLRHPEIRVLSFDVFDTLVIRLVEPPERIHHRLAERLARRLATSCRRVLWARQEVEAMLRQEAVAAGLDYECHWDELIPRWVERLTPLGTPEERSALSDWLRQEELALEEMALRAKRSALLFVRWAKRRGYRLIAISDMYLGEAQISALLDRLGFSDCFERIFVSSEHRQAKYSGRLFRHVLETMRIDAAELLHVGDNLHSDVFAPTRLEITAAFLDEPHWQLRRRNHFVAARCSQRFGGIWPGREVALILADALAHDPVAQQGDPHFRYGLTVLGPIFSTFLVGLLEKIARDHPERVYFLARDGALFQQMYEAARLHQPELPPSDYLYTSRRCVTAAAVADGLTFDHLRFALINPKQQGLHSLCKTFALPEALFRYLAERYGLVPFEAPLSANDPQVIRFLGDPEVQAVAREAGETARTLLHDYLTQHGFFAHERVALVDIGWNATIQRYLERNFAPSKTRYPQVFGYYFALSHGIHAEPIQFGQATGLFCDTLHGSPWERSPLDFEELFEQGARALHATITSYHRGEDGRVEPVFKSDDAPDRQAELVANPAIAALQAGVLCCWIHFQVVQQLAGYPFAALKPYALALCERAVVYPTPEELELVARLAHTEDLGHDHLLELVGAPLSWQSLRHPRRTLKALFSRSWPYAALANWRLPVAMALVRALFLRHRYLGK